MNVHFTKENIFVKCALAKSFNINGDANPNYLPFDTTLIPSVRFIRPKSRGFPKSKANEVQCGMLHNTTALDNCTRVFQN